MCPSRRSNTQQLGAGGGAGHHGAQGHGRRRARGTHLCGVLANSAGGLQRLERHQGTEPAHWDHIVPDLATARLRGKALDANSRSMLQLGSTEPLRITQSSGSEISCLVPQNWHVLTCSPSCLRCFEPRPPPGFHRFHRPPLLHVQQNAQCSAMISVPEKGLQQRPGFNRSSRTTASWSLVPGQPGHWSAS